MKKLLALALAGFMSVGLVACGGDEPEEPAVEDDEVAEESSESEESNIIEVPVTIKNSTGVEFAGLYMSGASLEEWGDNLIEGSPLADGESKELTLYVDANNLQWDLLIEDHEGATVTWNAVDISEMSTEGFTMDLVWEDGGEPICNLANY